jgi:DNA-directed RNA polymerase subunit N (RpoN/RPB10)
MKDVEYYYGKYAKRLLKPEHTAEAVNDILIERDKEHKVIQVQAEVIPFCVKFTEAQEGMEIEIVDNLTRYETTIKENTKEKDIFDDSFDMFSIGRWVIKTLKPKFREIVTGNKEI